MTKFDKYYNMEGLTEFAKECIRETDVTLLDYCFGGLTVQQINELCEEVKEIIEEEDE